MDQVFYFSYNENSTNEVEEGLAQKAAAMNVRFVERPTVAELTSAFRQFLKAAGYVD